MKKILLFMSAATMFAAISCNKVEVNSPQTQTPSVNHTHESIEFVAYTEVETKTTLNGYATEWEAGDEIDINEVVYIAQESGNKSVFTIVDPEAEVPEAPYHAGYPSTYVYDNNESIEGKLAFIFSNEHVLNEGEICEDVLAVAYSESEPSLYFKNVVSLLKFQVPEFTEDITEIRISTSEPLAGCVYVDYINATWTPDESEETFNEVILTANSGKFEVEKTYYVPVLPGEKKNLTVYINGHHAATVKEFECKRSVIHNIGVLPKPKANRNLAFSAATATATVNEDFSAPTLSGVTEGVKYESSNTTVAEVDALGNVTVKAVGETTITASAEESRYYLADEASYKLTVVPSTVRLYIESEKTCFDMKIYAWGIDGVEIPNAWPGQSLQWDATVKKYYYDFPYAIKGKTLNFLVNVNADQCKSADQKITFDDNEETFALNWKWLYFLPSNNWKEGGAWFAAYFFTDNSGEYWSDLQGPRTDGVYGVVVPNNHKKVIFTRMDGGKKGNKSWDAKWNQTSNLTVPTDSKNYFKCTEGWWDNHNGSWDTYSF